MSPFLYIPFKPFQKDFFNYIIAEILQLWKLIILYMY